MRPQYHFRNSPHGLLAWDIRKLADMAKQFPIVNIPLTSISELDEPFWFAQEGDVPTCRKVAEHAKMMQEVDLSYPIIIAPDGHVMDGMHRVCKALNQGLTFISAYQLPKIPDPDFIGISPEQLPYDNTAE